jgi:hypothetical protein
MSLDNRIPIAENTSPALQVIRLDAEADWRYFCTSAVGHVSQEVENRGEIMQHESLKKVNMSAKRDSRNRDVSSVRTCERRRKFLFRINFGNLFLE